MFLVLVLWHTVGADCPSVQCEPLSVGECAKRDAGIVLVNEYGCTKDATCLSEDFKNWYSSSSEVLLCVESSSEDSETQDHECGTRQSNRMLAQVGGQYVLHPKRCNSDVDCTLEDGSTTDCECGLDGYSYCKPEWGSEVFDDYWEYCDSNDGKVPYSFYEYYRDLQENYPYYILAPDCARNIIEELKGLVTKPDSAIWAVVGLVLFYLI